MTRYARHAPEYQQARDARHHRAMLARKADRRAADAIRATLSQRTAADAVALYELSVLVAL